ncbi:MAG: DUF4834 family protein [Prevotella sp.]|nr:DUF4834 family protein [Prevotella sp.]
MNGFEIGVFGLIGIAIVVLVIIFLMNRGLRKWRERAEENYILQMKRKEQKEKNPFGEDYFKSSDSPKQQKQKARQYQASQKQKETTAHQKTTSSGVTIIDDRAEDKKKIFEHGDGEYVEFEEVNG